MARTSEKLNAPVGVAFATSNRSNARTKIKVFKNKQVDDLLDVNFDVPGIPSKAIIKEMVVGAALIERLREKYKDK